MKPLRHVPLLLVPFALVAAFSLAGCSSSGETAASAPANSPEVARAYADCLTGEGIDGVFVNDANFVGVSVEAKPGGSGEAGDGGDSSIFMDASADGAYGEAEKACSARLPEYHAEVFDEDPVVAAQMIEQSRAFAACARQNGLSDFPDPDGATEGTLLVPEGTTKSAFLAVVTACAPAFGQGTQIADPSVDANAQAGQGQTFSIAMPQFGGAYDKAWAPEVTSLLFAALEPAEGTGQ
ncbi:hypothetical protein B7R22_00075 [Subtercola boreus]|uniref:Uncharacterized protein n=1 Tax=Subtercola boreus TaxID=120213 RepID=A0A3E0W6A7_9MICO|nr:hypothetical protein [Subtercola boreus]RFA17441.1 hypothetical protein B7R22_00075 [Subtercola boreus]